MTQAKQETKIFYRSNLNDQGAVEGALQDCLNAGYRALNLPEIADKRIRELGQSKVLSLSEIAYIRRQGVNEGLGQWFQCFTTTSLSITGTPTGQKEVFTIYWHQPTDFATPRGIFLAKQEGLVNYAGRFPQTVFDAIYELAVQEKPHLIVPNRKIQELRSDPLSETIKDPRVIALFDGQERAARYVPLHASIHHTMHDVNINYVFGTKKISFEDLKIGVRHSKNLDHESPFVRLITLCDVVEDGDYTGGIAGSGCFLGVCNVIAEGESSK